MRVMGLPQVSASIASGSGIAATDARSQPAQAGFLAAGLGGQCLGVDEQPSHAVSVQAN